MANRVPLVIDASTLYLKELPANDNLDLTGSGIHNAGVITATSFSGDGSGLTGVAAGYFEKTSVGINTLTNVGIGTTNPTSTLTVGGNANVTGVVTATTFIGALTGNASGTAGGLSGTPDITIGNLVGVAATFTGVVTYEDTTSVDSIGIITARKQIVAQGGIFEPHGTTVTYTVKVASKTAAHRYQGSGSGSGYFIDDVEAPFITLTPGRTYKFDTADSSVSGHPFRFYYEANKTTAYTTGVTENGTAGSAGAYTQIVVSDTTPAILHYQCGAHGYMGNAVSTKGVTYGNPTNAVFYGDGSNLTGVISGTELKQAGTSVGTGVTQINFASGATLTSASAGISTVTIAAGITTAAQTGAAGVITINLDNAQHHDIYLAAGISTVTCTGGTAGDSHSIIFTHPSTAGVTTVGFSTYFMFPSGSVPVLSGGSNKVDLVSFVLKRQGTAGIGTQLLASAGLDYQ